MRIGDEIDEHFRLLVVEVRKQILDMEEILLGGKTVSKERIQSREGYVDNLTKTLNARSFRLLAGKQDKQLALKISGFITMINNLERMGDLCEDIISQASELPETPREYRFDFSPYLNTVKEGMDKIGSAVFSDDLKTTLEICQLEVRLDRLYAEDFRRISERIRLESGRADYLVKTLLVLRSLERMGDSLKNIAESVISSIVGSRIKFNQYLALQRNLDHDEEIRIENLGEDTRSGCRIDKVRKSSEPSGEVIFKEGIKSKVSAEMNKLLFWEKSYPGLAPRVINYQEEDRNASVVMEFLPGYDLKNIIHHGDPDLHKAAADALVKTLKNLWDSSRQPGRNKVSFMNPVKKRLKDVLIIHPEFEKTDIVLDDRHITSLYDLIDKVKEVEKTVRSPFQVLLHGDFNIDNVIYNQNTNTIHFIDVHRSGMGDYVKDATVFMVSNFRLPVFEPDLRRKLNHGIDRMYEFVREYARENDDETFHLRMALGLARSFVTSSRFSTDKYFAGTMFNRGLELLEKVAQSKPDEIRNFRIRKEILFY